MAGKESIFRGSGDIMNLEKLIMEAIDIRKREEGNRLKSVVIQIEGKEYMTYGFWLENDKIILQVV